MIVTMTETRYLTEDQVLRREAAREAERLASKLDQLAERIRHTSRQFENTPRPAVAIVADLVNDYVQGTGSAGPILWGLIRELMMA
jgi:hypothetical protein